MESDWIGGRENDNVSKYVAVVCFNYSVHGKINLKILFSQKGNFKARESEVRESEWINGML